MIWITRNAVRCPTYVGAIESMHQHNFIKNSRGAISVDGDYEHARLGEIALETGAWEALCKLRNADGIPDPWVIRGKLGR